MPARLPILTSWPGFHPAICPRNDAPPRCDPIDPGQMAGSTPGHDDEFADSADPR